MAAKAPTLLRPQPFLGKGAVVPWHLWEDSAARFGSMELAFVITQKPSARHTSFLSGTQQSKCGTGGAFLGEGQKCPQLFPSLSCTAILMEMCSRQQMQMTCSGDLGKAAPSPLWPASPSPPGGSWAGGGAAVAPTAQARQMLLAELMDGLYPWGTPSPPCLPHFPSVLLLWRLRPAWNSCPGEGKDTWRAASEAMPPQAPGKQGPAGFQASRAAPVLFQIAALPFPLQTERLLPSQWCSSWDPGALASPP